MEQGTTYIINLYYIITLHNQSVFGSDSSGKIRCDIRFHLGSLYS